MTTVAILCGGNSPERAVSIRSGAAVTTALNDAGYQTVVYDPAQSPRTELLPLLRQVDVVFPVLHGIGGEDGELQAWLETYHVPFVGAGSAASKKCFDKWQYKQILINHSIKTPRGEIVDEHSLRQSRLIEGPFVLKPYDGGSSVDTFIVRDPAAADMAALSDALARNTRMLLEELIEGQEITVGVLGNTALPVIEIIPPADGEFDYENKYNGKSAELCPPQHISQAVQAQAQAIAEQIHRQLSISGMSRTDIMLRRSDSALFILETNTIPGMTEQSLLPKAAAAAGLTMPDVVKRLVDDVLGQSGKHKIV